MGFAELNGEYVRLRNELDAAYSGPVWNPSTIDRIAEQIVQVEFAIASAQSARSGNASAAPASSRSRAA